MNAVEFLRASLVPPEQIPWAALYDRVTNAGKEKDLSFLEELFSLFERDDGKLSRLYYTIPGMVLDGLIRARAPQDLSQVISYLIRNDALLSKMSSVLNDPYQRRRALESVRRSAAVAAHCGSGPYLSSVRERHPLAVEFVACCAQEALLRDYVFSSTEVASIVEMIQGHPLSSLPLERYPLESLVVLRPYLFSAGGMSGVGVPGFTRELDTDIAVQTPTIKKQHIDPAALQEVYVGAELCNARVEVARFMVEPPTPLSSSLLELLPLQCTGRSREVNEDGDSYWEDPPRPIKVFACTPEEAYLIFFSSGYSGRCYQAWSFSAWARLRAWRAMGSICGGVSLSEVDRLARSASYLFFLCESAWYDHISFDIGLAVQDGSSGAVTIFAGTDSD